jgi:tetratricopeptide (TPR) repeat protein
MMLVASLLPWYYDPLGSGISPWQIPVDLGWQVRSSIFSYGLLCLCCALLALTIPFSVWRTRPGQPVKITASRCILIAFCCLLPAVLFVTQFLFVDMERIAWLSNQEVQMLLIRAKFGYGASPQFVPLKPLLLEAMTLDGRVALLLNKVDGGFFLPLLSMMILIGCRNLFPLSWRLQFVSRRHAGLLLAGLALAVLLLGRGPAALACTAYADGLLMHGEYAGALNWLNQARWLNPALEHLSAFHIKRGQAWHFLHPHQPNADSKVYLAATYRQQSDFLASYQELQHARQYAPEARWVTDEISMTLTRLIEMSKPVKGAMNTQRLDNNRRALTWLQALARVDPASVYAHYTMGRIYCDFKENETCEQYMQQVLRLTGNREIRSSAYTYLGLSHVQRGDVATARRFFFTAQELDIEFRNNTVRQALSGLR